MKPGSPLDHLRGCQDLQICFPGPSFGPWYSLSLLIRSQILVSPIPPHFWSQSTHLEMTGS